MRDSILDQVHTHHFLLPILIGSSAALVILINAYGLASDITSILPHLFYIPIFLAAYFYPRRGIPAAAGLAAVYCAVVVMFKPGDNQMLMAAVERSVLFVILGAGASYLSARVHDDARKSRRLISIIESSGDAIIGKTLGGIVTDWNSGAEQLYGYTAGEIVGRPISILLPPERPDDVIHLLEQISRGESIKRYETKRMTKDKKIIDVSLSIWPMKNEAGEIIGASTSAHDITEKKQLEDEILKAKNEWERTFDAVPDMIAIIDKDYRIIRVNRAMADRLGLQPGEVAGHHCYEMVHHQDHPVSLCPHQALLADGQHHVQELHDEILGGDFVVSVSPLKDSSGTVTGSVHLIRDITCSKAAQRQIEDHHNFLERLLETITNPIFYKDKNGVYTGCNSAFEQYLGLKKDQIVGKSVYDIAPADLADIYYAKDKELFDHPGTQTYEAQVKYADGSIHDVIFSKATFTDSEGNIDGLVGIIVDISERKRAEEELRFRNILLATQQEVSIDAILVVGENGEILSYNRRFVDLWQIPPEVIRTKSDELALQSVLDKLSNPREFIDRITYLYEHRHEQSRDEIILNDGRTLDRYSAPMIGSDGHYYGRIWYFRDITERRRAEDSLQQANKKLNMLSSITRHDILNQVMGLRTYLELSKESTTDPQLLDFIRKEDEVAIAIGRQIEFTRSYQDIGMQAPAWQDAGKIIASAAAQLDLKDIALENAVSGTEIFADPLVEKVFYNLMENSLRHGKHVTSVSFSSADNNAGFVITYRDNGVGISADDKQKLFQKGFGSHTGLGLFLSREILSITGISIQENGTPGQGVNFEIIVPKGRYRRISPSPEKI